MKAKGLTLMSLVVLMGLFGCASHKIKALTPESIEAYRVQETVGDVTIAADAFDTEKEVEETFTVNLNAGGYVPVLLVMDNHSEDNMLLVKDEIELLDSAGNMLKPVPANVMVEDFEHNKMAYALLGFGIFSYMSAEEANEDMKKDWSGKELPMEKVLIPHRKIYGVIYFKLGEGLAALSNSTLHVPVHNMRTGETHSAKLRLAGGVPVPDVGSSPQEKKEEEKLSIPYK